MSGPCPRRISSSLACSWGNRDCRETCTSMLEHFLALISICLEYDKGSLHTLYSPICFKSSLQAYLADLPCGRVLVLCQALTHRFVRHTSATCALFCS